MKVFNVHRGKVVPLDRANVDTDAIIPKQFLKSIKRSGFGPNLFDEWRYLDVGEPGKDNSKRPLNPDFVLNQPRYAGASILVARENFGCGSSREHAPWALDDYGFRCIIAPSFADIFYNNCFKNGLLPLRMTESQVSRIFDDVKAFVKNLLTSGAAGGAAAAPAGGTGAALGLLPWPKVDFEKFGPVEKKPLSRIKKISGANLHRNWVMIPHVTNHEDADITDLEAFRVKLNTENAKAGIKLTMLAFLVKASVAALKKFPEFNASLDGETLVYKNYYHIGFAADTPNGLVVPVIKDADKKGVLEIAVEMGELAKKARDGKLGPADMQGGTFSISSLGGIGGTYFTPIINAPEVAILGVCRSAKRPVWDEARGEFVPRLILPLSLSWDHRVIDGAAAARFAAYLAQVLADFRRVML